MKYKKEITIKELREIIGETTLEAQLNFWQKASDFQKGLIKNLKEKGYKINNTPI